MSTHYVYSDAYKNRKLKAKLDHLGGTIKGICDVVGGDYFHNGNHLVPVGTVIQYISNTAPGGWLVCDGGEVNKSEYSRLYAIIGDTFGIAFDASKNFILPDLRGRVPLGSGQGVSLTSRTIGNTGGSETHTLTESEMPSHTHTGSTDTSGNHTHTITDPGHNHTVANTVQYNQNTRINADNTNGEIDLDNSTTTNSSVSTTGISIDSSGAHTHTFTTNSTGGSDAHNNMQPFLVLNYIIRY